jgi:hypothetical protein
MFMSVCRIAVAVLLFFIGSGFSQDRGAIDHWVTLPMVQKILSSERRSGSLEYWSFCDFDKRGADFPEPRPVIGRQGPALDLLQEMFADHPKMQVTQEPDGKIRMVETDIPQDLLEVKIHHLSFASLYHGRPFNHSGAMAVYVILNTPEVIAFMDHNIGRTVAWEGWGMPGQLSFDGPSVPGELNDVTVEQALDYVLQTFQGFWFYQNCHYPNGARMISVGFVRNLPPVSDAPLPKTE